MFLRQAYGLNTTLLDRETAARANRTPVSSRSRLPSSALWRSPLRQIPDPTHFLTRRGPGEARTAGEKGPENADPINAMVISS